MTMPSWNRELLMGRLVQHLALGLLFCSLPACFSASYVPQPVLQRGDRASLTGDSTASQDLRTCQIDVRAAAPVSIQPRWLPPLGAPGNGVVLGTVESPHPVWPSREAYRQAIEACLTARGYEIHGWQ